MPVTFSSKAFENIVMLEDVAKKLLVLMGNSPTIPGALLANELPNALQSLEAGIKQNTAGSTQENPDYAEPEISLAHRAIPLVNMLKAAIKDSANVMWK